MTIYNNVVDAIGNTPLIKLKRASELTGCTILGKAAHLTQSSARHRFTKNAAAAAFRITSVIRRP